MKRYRMSPLTERDYLEVKEYLAFKDNKYTSERTGYSMSTVNLVNRTKNFAEYQSYNKSRRGRIKTTRTYMAGQTWTARTSMEEDIKYKQFLEHVDSQRAVNDVSLKLFRALGESLDTIRFTILMIVVAIAAFFLTFITLALK